MAEGLGAPYEVAPPRSAKKYWTRKGIAQWLIDRLIESPVTLVGIDHAFSFPISYFRRHSLPLDWPGFLDDFHRHWPTDGDHASVDLVRHGNLGNGALRTGVSTWRRLADQHARTAKSPFHFDVQGSVAKSTHSGLPWLRFIRHAAKGRVHFWPFDGWEPPRRASVIAEAYPALWNRTFPREDRTPDQHDAWCIASWMQRADRDHTLPLCFQPQIPGNRLDTASIEGWILGLA